MAAKKTTTSKTSGSKTTAATTSTAKNAASKGSGNFPQAYVRFRTVLDALELTAMRYCLKDKNAAKRIARAEELERVLMPIIIEYENQMRSNVNVQCPEGMFDCGNCCLGYPCP
ncbi:MAG: hypothetical protein ACR2MG_04715 [Pyrinomonadaceae bacterium]